MERGFLFFPLCEPVVAYNNSVFVTVNGTVCKPPLSPLEADAVAHVCCVMLIAE